MKIIVKPFLWISLAGLFLISCKKPDAPEFRAVRNVEINNLENDQVELMADADFYNPNNYRIILKTADIAISFNGKKITDFHHKYDLAIEKKSTFTVPLKFVFSKKDLNDNLIGTAISILLGKKISLEYTGHIKVRAWGFGIRVPVDGETRLDLKNL